MELPSDLIEHPIEDDTDQLVKAEKAKADFMKLITSLRTTEGSDALALFKEALELLDTEPLNRIAERLSGSNAIKLLKEAMIPELETVFQTWNDRLPESIRASYQFELDNLARIRKRIKETDPNNTNYAVIRMLRDSVAMYIQGDIRREIECALQPIEETMKARLDGLLGYIDRRELQIKTSLDGLPPQAS